MKLKALVGSGQKIMLFALPFLIVGLILNWMFPAFFSVAGPSGVLPAIVRAISLGMIILGVIIWIWSVVLIATKIPRREMITSGPYALMKHPLYTGVALLVLPGTGFLCGTWLGVVIGAAVYAGSRIFAPEEEAILAKTFGAAWDEYCSKVKIPWL